MRLSWGLGLFTFALLLVLSAAGDGPTCPICGMDVDTTSPSLRFNDDGHPDKAQVVQFCSESHRDTFKNDIPNFFDKTQPYPSFMDGKSVIDPYCGMSVTVKSTSPKLSFKNGQSLFFCSSGCEGHVEQDPKSFLQDASPPSPSPSALKCPLCGMDVDQSSPSVSWTKGQKVYFCSNDHKTMFAENPKTYVASTSDDSEGSGGMQMWFYSGYDVVILFKWWHTRSAVGYAFSCLGIIVVCIAHEYLTTLRATIGTSMKKYEAERGLLNSRGLSRRLTSRLHIVKTLLYLVSLLLAYLLMLITMTMNVGLFLAVPVGLGIGYYLFGAQRGESGTDSSDVCCAQA
eukprot:GILI01011511.1.p1 GENE.GILI01011511.1~~GILI01011511.1.p1  ORF type:complete len:343 (+),score=52.79 GILI01011511.1:89-1117(+)